MADKAIEEYLRGITLHLDTISCDLEMFRIALQVLLFHLIDGGPDKNRAYHSLRHELLGAIENTVRSGPDVQGSARRKQLIRMSAEALLQEIGEAVGIPSTKPGPSDVS